MPSTLYQKAHVKVADELYIIVALLHRENPSQEAFTLGEIRNRAKQEGLGEVRADQKSLCLHAYEHAAANLPPRERGGRYRMVYRQPNDRIRLLRAGDFVHPERTQKFYPDPNEVPEKYRELLEWARSRTASSGTPEPWLQGLLELRGLGREVWRGVEPDGYVRGLREGWE